MLETDLATLKSQEAPPENSPRIEVKSIVLAALIAGVGGALVGLFGGNSLGTVSTKRELSACLGIELPSAQGPAQIRQTIEHCLPGDDLAMARTALLAQLQGLESPKQ